MRLKKFPRHDKLRRHLKRALGAHDRWSRDPVQLRRTRAYVTATSPTIAHLMEDDDVFEAYCAKLEAKSS